LGGGVRGDPVEGGGHGASSHPDVFGDVVGEGVDHDGGVDALEGTAGDHVFLAGVALFGGGTEQHEASLEAEAVGGGAFGVGKHGRRGEERADTRGGDDVVPARVPDLGQRIVFGEDGDGGMTRRVIPLGAPTLFQ